VLTTETHSQRCHRCGKAWLVFTQKGGADDRPFDASDEHFPRVLNRGWYYGVQHRDGTVTMSLGWGRKEAEAFADAISEVPTQGLAIVDA
jgi:hypothetical protein